MISKRIRTLFWKVYLLKDAILKKKVYAELSNLAKTLEEDVFRRLLEKGALGSKKVTDLFLSILFIKSTQP
jgi:hypothetical protein